MEQGEKKDIAIIQLWDLNPIIKRNMTKSFIKKGGSSVTDLHLRLILHLSRSHLSGDLRSWAPCAMGVCSQAE
jgi:hypothetical protein